MCYNLKNIFFFFIRKLSKRSSAYSLMEILVVLTIVGILLSIAVPRISKSRQTADAIACKKELESLVYSLELWSTTHEQYPESLKDLVTGGFIAEKGLLDPWGRAYVYRPVSAEDKVTDYQLSSLGPDGQADSADDVKAQR